MPILFHNGTPEALRHYLAEHEVTAAREVGRERLVNGRLPRVAEDAGFELLPTTDKNIQYQQILAGRCFDCRSRVREPSLRMTGSPGARRAVEVG